ncbi:MAG: cobalamin biosynthesis protein P47K [Actinobacteria bacterium]|nr:cobalamin biosynthesis protein P47K [Actinomycetota bacterium]
MTGGFLGAGKTTLLLRLGEWLTGRGLRVGLVTNDQAGGLVDTSLGRAHDLAVEEIAGGCFCCRFNSLLEAAEALGREQAADILLAEPVGSCTDLVATVSLPLEQLHGERFELAPFSVVLDPLRAARILGLAAGPRFSEHVEYIYRKQLEEAECIVINKIDLADEVLRTQLRQALAREFPTARLFELSAREGTDVHAWCEAMLSERSAAAAIADLDYDRYADGESLLGWLNADIRLAAHEAEQGGEFDGNDLLLELLTTIRGELAATGFEIAHLKATLSVEGDDYELAAANLVRTDDAPTLSHRLAEPIDIGRLLLNLRAEADPDLLKQAIHRSLKTLADRCEVTVNHLEHFRPGRPVPTHRLTGIQRSAT